jgi:arginyl-tRNA--protein-N-Asp/Glu arginylyltransferase
LNIRYNNAVGITMKKLEMQDRFPLTEDLPCPYIDDDRTASLEFIFPAEGLAPNFHKFLATGYRRLGSVLYRNVCRGCSSCRPIRLETEKFRASRSQRRTLRKNRDVRVECRTPSVTPARIDLYGRYVASKHPAGQEDDIRDCPMTLSSLHHGYAGSIEMDYFLEERLIAIGVVDEGEDALSSAYFYYDTGHLDRRPGIFSILKEISLALSMRKKYYYLGFCVEETSKMSYKKFFRPNQIYDDGEWKNFLVR